MDIEQAREDENERKPNNSRLFFVVPATHLRGSMVPITVKASGECGGKVEPVGGWEGGKYLSTETIGISR